MVSNDDEEEDTPAPVTKCKSFITRWHTNEIILAPKKAQSAKKHSAESDTETPKTPAKKTKTNAAKTNQDGQTESKKFTAPCKAFITCLHSELLGPAPRKAPAKEEASDKDYDEASAEADNQANTADPDDLDQSDDQEDNNQE